jgi:hypothetical protein
MEGKGKTRSGAKGKSQKLAGIDPLKDTSPEAVALLLAQVINDQLKPSREEWDKAAEQVPEGKEMPEIVPEMVRQLKKDQADMVQRICGKLMKAHESALLERQLRKVQRQLDRLTGGGAGMDADENNDVVPLDGG